ncbi:MAG: pantetheine-phosphate adenylyltransferase [Firmicutes bacterium]|nr:pantetheine-phosphate adenylyltransferase [Bacillota bacterium]
MKKVLIAGSFDPVTVGHLDMIKRSAPLCEQLDVGVIKNYSKASMFTPEQRMKMLAACTSDIKNVRIISFEGHLASFVLANGYDAVIRGLRGSSDFGYEIQLSQIYDEFYKGRVQTLYLMTSPQYSYITSSIVRENFMLGADVSDWVPEKVLPLMKKYYKKGEEK